MKVHLQKDQFLNGLQTVQNIVNPRNTIPVLGNVLIKTQDNGTVLLATTDLDIGIKSEIKARVEESGAITLPAKRLLNIIREIPTAEFSLEIDKKFDARIRSGKYFSRIKGITEEDFPPFPKLEGLPLVLPQLILKEMVKSTSYCMSSDENRYTLNGLYFNFTKQKLIVVATDGRRLALSESPVNIDENYSQGVIVPSKAVYELERILGDQGDVEIILTENQIAITAGSNQLVSKLVDGKYPNYQQVIPSDTTQRATIEREILLSAVKRVSVLSTDRTHSVKFKFTDGNLEISTITPDVGEANESIPAQYKGDEFSISFNPEYVMDPLRNINSENVHIDFSDELSPAIFRHNKPFLYVIMPMRTS